MHLQLVILVPTTCVIPENHRRFRVRLGVCLFLRKYGKVTQGGLGKIGWKEEGVRCMLGFFLLGLFYFLCGGLRPLFLCGGREGSEARMLKKVLFWTILNLNMMLNLGEDDVVSWLAYLLLLIYPLSFLSLFLPDRSLSTRHRLLAFRPGSNHPCS